MKNFYKLLIITLLSINITISYYFYTTAMLSWGEGGTGDITRAVSIVTTTISLTLGLIFIFLSKKGVIQNNKLSSILVIIISIGTAYPLMSILL